MIEQMVDQCLIILELLPITEQAEKVVKIIPACNDGWNLNLLTCVGGVGECLFGRILGIRINWW